MSEGDLTEHLRVNYALAAELEETRKVRDEWSAEYVKVRDALKGLLLCLEGEFDGEKLAKATNRATAAMGHA